MRNFLGMRIIYAMFLSMLSSLFLTVPAASTGLSAKGASALRKTLWDKNLREDNTLDDIWNKLKTSVDIRNNKIEIPNSVFMQFSTAPTGTHQITIGMTAPYEKAPAEGTDETILGYEEDSKLFHLTLRYNELKKSVSMRGWGVDYNDIQSTGLYGTINPRLQKFWKDYRGKRIRVTSMLNVEDALTKNPIGLKQNFCSNVFIPNLAAGLNPTWDITDLTNTAGVKDSLGYYSQRTFSGANTYIESLAARMMQASGTTSASKAYMHVENLEDLYQYCRRTVRMNPISIGPNRGYIYVADSDTVSILTNPNRAGSMAEIWTKVTQLSSEEQSYPGMLGRYKNLWIIEDDRHPTLTIGGSAGSYALQPGFMNPGNNDDRNLSAWSATSGSLNYVFNVGFVYGEGGLAEWIANDLGYADESTEYGQLLGKGSYMCGGIQIARFNVDTPDDAANSASTGAGNQLIQRGVVMVLTSKVPTYTLR
jgi:hypothetical protein